MEVCRIRIGKWIFLSSSCLLCLCILSCHLYSIPSKFNQSKAITTRNSQANSTHSEPWDNYIKGYRVAKKRWHRYESIVILDGRQLYISTHMKRYIDLPHSQYHHPETVKPTNTILPINIPTLLTKLLVKSHIIINGIKHNPVTRTPITVYPRREGGRGVSIR